MTFNFGPAFRFQPPSLDSLPEPQALSTLGKSAEDAAAAAPDEAAAAASELAVQDVT